MWINQTISEKIKRKEDAACGVVTAGGNKRVNVQTDKQCLQLPVVAPCGIAYAAAEGAEAVVLPLNGGKVCLGGIIPDKGLMPGEIMLYSAGGATLVLKNDGSILANGKPL